MKHRICLMILGALGLSLPAAALVKAPTPVASFYATAHTVVVGKVTSVAASGNVTTSARTLKGEPVGDGLKIKLDAFPDVVKNLKEGAPVVLLVARRTAALSIDDQWLLPEAAPSSRNLYVAKTALGDALRQSYPGTSSALVKAVEELAANNGKYSMYDEVSPEMFHGGVKSLGQVDPPGATELRTIIIDRKQHLLAGNRMFVVDGGAIKPAVQATMTGVAADALAVGQVELGGKAVLASLDKSGALSLDGKSAKPLWSGVQAVTAAIGNFGEDGSAAAIVVTEDQITRYALDGASAPADFLRLTGEKISTYHRENPKWLASATARSLDCNGDGRMDILINAPAGPMLLINRGFGCFFINADLGKVLKTDSGSALPGKDPWTGIDVDGDGNDDLLIVSPTGAASAVLNPKRGK